MKSGVFEVPWKSFTFYYASTESENADDDDDIAGAA